MSTSRFTLSFIRSIPLHPIKQLLIPLHSSSLHFILLHLSLPCSALYYTSPRRTSPCPAPTRPASLHFTPPHRSDPSAEHKVISGVQQGGRRWGIIACYSRQYCRSRPRHQAATQSQPTPPQPPVTAPLLPVPRAQTPSRPTPPCDISWSVLYVALTRPGKRGAHVPLVWHTLALILRGFKGRRRPGKGDEGVKGC